MAKKLTMKEDQHDGCACGGNCGCKDQKNPYVGIAASLGGLFVAVVAIFAIFANSSIGSTVPIAFAFALLGIFLGHFASKKQ